MMMNMKKKKKPRKIDQMYHFTSQEKLTKNTFFPKQYHRNSTEQA